MRLSFENSRKYNLLLKIFGKSVGEVEKWSGKPRESQRNVRKFYSRNKVGTPKKIYRKRRKIGRFLRNFEIFLTDFVKKLRKFDGCLRWRRWPRSEFSKHPVTNIKYRQYVTCLTTIFIVVPAAIQIETT